MSTPWTKHPLLVDCEKEYDLVTTILGGTQSMRDANTDYLPREPEEALQNYNRRLNRTTLFPAFKNATITNTGKLFKNGLQVNNSTPALDIVFEDVDEDGNKLETFAEEVTQTSMQYGVTYILVDYPAIDDDATLQDQLSVNAQPYWTEIHPETVLEASPIFKNGKKQLGVFRYKQRVAYRKDEFTVTYVDQVKQFSSDGTTVTYVTYQKVDGKEQIVDQGTLEGVTEIPITPLYTNKVGYYLGCPLFIDLAYENVLNWQLLSDYLNLCNMSQCPMLQIKGAPQNFDGAGNKQTLTISPNTTLDFPDPQSGADWVEVSGTAAAVGRATLEESYLRMSELSYETLTQRTVGGTATEALLDAEEASALMKTLQSKVEEAINTCIEFTNQYLGTTSNTTVELIESNPEETLVETVEAVDPTI